MKKSILSLMIGAVVALTSCSKSDQLPTATQEGDQPTTFQVEAPATRTAVSGLTRYIVEAYEGKDLTVEPVRAETATGSMTVVLKKNTDYMFLFWADKGTAATEGVASSGYWNTNDLQAVTVTETEKNKVGEVAYCHKLDLNSKDLTPNYAIELKNATAQVNFIEGIGLETADNTLKVTYAAGSTLNVGTGEISEVTGAITRTFTGIAKAAKEEVLATDYVLAPLNEQNMLNIEMQFNTEAEKELTNVPFQQNYKTNIKGEFSNFYSSVFTISNEVDDYVNNPDVEFPQLPANVGDFYYSDNTYSTALDASKTCIGIVYEVNADGITGKVVGLTEGTSLKWSTEKVETGDLSQTDGRQNMATLATFISSNGKSWDLYPAFKWVAEQNSKTDGGWADTDKWYLPAIEELKALCAAWNGGATTPANTEARAAFNTRLTSAQGTALGSSTFWSSTEASSNTGDAWYVNFAYGNASNDAKGTSNYVRCVREF